MVKQIKKTELWTRIKSESPKFFKQLRNIALGVGTSVIGVLSADTMLELNLSANLITVLKYTVAVCVAIAGTSILTKKV